MPLSDDTEICPYCEHPRWRLLRAEAVAVYDGPWRKAVQALKYHRDLGLALLFAEVAVRRVRRLRWPITCVIPIPLSEPRHRARGYNQVHLWASRMARRLGLPYCAQGLRRVRDTASQVMLDHKARWENVRAAFVARTKAVEGQRVLLVDDVLTTGATLNEAADALLQAGAVAVYGFTLARTLLPGVSEFRASGAEVG